MPRPWLVEFYQCNNVTVNGVTLQNSPMWHTALRFSNQINVSGITVNTSGSSPNTDGIDLVGATQVTISNVHLADGDDDVAIKSGLPINAEIPNDPNEAGLPVQATSHVVISNATLGTGHGISVGSEAAYGVNNVLIQNVTYNGTADGFRIKTGRDRGSQIYDITLQNITMTNVPLPISIQAFYPGSSAPNPPPAPITPTSTTPYVHDVTIQNLTATGATSQSVIEGLPESCMLRINLTNVKHHDDEQGTGAGEHDRHVQQRDHHPVQRPDRAVRGQRERHRDLARHHADRHHPPRAGNGGARAAASRSSTIETLTAQHSRRRSRRGC